MPSTRQPSPSGRRGRARASPRGAAAGLVAARRCRSWSPVASPGRSSARSSARAGEHDEARRADRRRRVRAGVHGAAELLEHDGGVDHAHARAAVRLGHEQAGHAEVGEAAPDRRRSCRRGVVVAARARTASGAALGEERAATLARSSSCSARELEVHLYWLARSARFARRRASGARHATELPFAAVRLRYGDAEEAFRAELVAWLEAHAPPREVLDRAEAVERATSPTGRATWQRTLFDAGWLVPGLAARARRAQRHRRRSR